MKYFKKIVGDRIYLSPMNTEDAEKYIEWLTDRRVSDGLNHTKKVLNVEGEREWILSSLKKGDYQFAIVRKEDDTLLGNCGFNDIDNMEKNAEIGLFIGEEENRSKGYGAEVLKLLLDYGFNYLNFHNIYLHVYSFNERAYACYKKVGFKECGRMHEAYRQNGKWYDIIEMEILEDEYRKEI